MHYRAISVHVTPKSIEVHGLQCMLHEKTVVSHGFQPCYSACYMGNCQITCITVLFQLMLHQKVINYIHYNACYIKNVEITLITKVLQCLLHHKLPNYMHYIAVSLHVTCKHE